MGGYTNSELSKIFGVSRGAIVHWELGRREVPRWVTKLITLIYKGRITLDDWEKA